MAAAHVRQAAAGGQENAVCLISGGNIDVNILSRVITRGLVMSGRKTNLMIALEDKPGQLSLVSDIVSACGANVVSVHHDRSRREHGHHQLFPEAGAGDPRRRADRDDQGEADRGRI